MSLPPRDEPAGSRLAYSATILAVFLDAVTFSMLGPILPALQRRVGLSDFSVSLVFSGFSAGLLVGFLMAGYLMVRFGNRRTVLAGVLGHALGDLGFILSDVPVVVACARSLQGLASGAVWIGAVFAVLASRDERTGIRLGGLLLAYWVGSTIGPGAAALGGVVRPFSAHLTLTVIVFALLTAWLPHGARQFRWGGWLVLRDRSFLLVSASVAFTGLVFGLLHGSYTLRFATRLSASGLAILFVAANLVAGGASMLGGSIRDPRVALRVVRSGIFLIGALVVAVSWAAEPALWFPLVISIALVVGMIEAAGLRIVGGLFGHGIVLGLVAWSQAWGIGYMIGPILGTGLTQWGGPLVAGVVILALGTLMTGISGRRW